mmetsp:Transcript_98986/g.258049  ORF Transcript_98986/g.258049 Transcript_98986/m.258049 type:complete len:281 (+) Transcript_98986:216-1058(+)
MQLICLNGGAKQGSGIQLSRKRRETCMVYQRLHRLARKRMSERAREGNGGGALPGRETLPSLLIKIKCEPYWNEGHPQTMGFLHEVEKECLPNPFVRHTDSREEYDLNAVPRRNRLHYALFVACLEDLVRILDPLLPKFNKLLHHRNITITVKCQVNEYGLRGAARPILDSGLFHGGMRDPSLLHLEVPNDKATDGDGLNKTRCRHVAVHADDVSHKVGPVYSDAEDARGRWTELQRGNRPCPERAEAQGREDGVARGLHLQEIRPDAGDRNNLREEAVQ